MGPWEPLDEVERDNHHIQQLVQDSGIHCMAQGSDKPTFYCCERNGMPVINDAPRNGGTDDSSGLLSKKWTMGGVCAAISH